MVGGTGPGAQRPPPAGRSGRVRDRRSPSAELIGWRPGGPPTLAPSAIFLIRAGAYMRAGAYVYVRDCVCDAAKWGFSILDEERQNAVILLFCLPTSNMVRWMLLGLCNGTGGVIVLMSYI